MLSVRQSISRAQHAPALTRGENPHVQIHRFEGGGGKTLTAALLALAALLAASLLALSPAHAQSPTDPANITIGEPLGSLSLLSWFELTATVTDSNGDPVPDGTAVTWERPETTTGQVQAVSSWSTTTMAGRAYARFFVTVPGSIVVTARAGPVTDARVLSVGSDVPGQPPDPAALRLESPYSSRQTAGSFTVQALITDTNGAAVPDGTPISWEMNGLSGLNAQFTAISQDRVTANGIASATYTVAPASASILAIARAGGASASITFSVPEPAPAIRVTVELDSHEEWELVQIGDTVTFTATVTDAVGAAIADGTAISWSVPAGVRASGRNALVELSTDSQTTSGSASATYRVISDQWIWVQATVGNVTGLSELRGNIGAYPNAPDDLALSLRLIADSDNIVPTDSTLRVSATLTYTGGGRDIYVSGGTLRVVGSQEWADNGRSRLLIAGQTVQSFSLEDPNTCNGISADGETDWTCTVQLNDASIYIPSGTPDGTFTISGVITVNGREYRDELEITIGTVDEVAEVQFDFAEQTIGADRGKPYPSSVPAGGSTRFRLSILNENGGASATGSVGSVLLTATSGALSTTLGGGCEGGGATCRIPVSAITGANADRIVITLAHPGANKAGATTVRATVITNDGESFTPPPLTVTFVGDAETLAISEPTAGLLAHAAAEDGDNRDTLKLTVTAADAAGNDVELPYRAPRATITGPDDKTVTSGLSVVWTEDSDDADNNHDRFTRNADDAVQATVTVTAPATAPLATGEYTLELRTDGKTASQTFTVIGAVDSVTLGEPSGSLQVNGRVSLTATVRDAGGTLVPDGTPVEWSSQSTSDSTVLVQLSVDRVTTDGTATAEYIAVNAGAAAVKASAGDFADVSLVSIAPQPPTPPDGDAAEPRLSDGLTSRSPGSYTVWTGAAETTASALLAELSGVSAISLADEGAWLRYAGADSPDFAIARGAVLWLTAE